MPADLGVRALALREQAPQRRNLLLQHRHFFAHNSGRAYAVQTKAQHLASLGIDRTSTTVIYSASPSHAVSLCDVE